MKRAEEERMMHKVAAQRVTEAKLLRWEVQMPEASNSRQNGEMEVSRTSPSQTSSYAIHLRGPFSPIQLWTITDA